VTTELDFGPRKDGGVYMGVRGRVARKAGSVKLLGGFNSKASTYAKRH